MKETDFDDDDGDLSDRSRESKLVPPPAPPQLLLLPAAPAAALRRVTAIALGEIERERKTQRGKKQGSNYDSCFQSFELFSLFFSLSQFFSKKNSFNYSFRAAEAEDDDASRAPSAATRADRSSMASLEGLLAAQNGLAPLLGFLAEAVTTTLPSAV